MCRAPSQKYRHLAPSAHAPIRPLRSFGPRSGRASLWALALLSVSALALWLLNRENDAAVEIPGPALTAQDVSQEAPSGLPEAEAGSAAQQRGGEGTARPLSASRTDGIGSLRGMLLDRIGEGVPKRWTLVMSPNAAIRTPTPRQELRVKFEAAEERFDIQDVPLGAYDVWIEASGINRRATPVLLVRGSESPFISLELHARGYLEGVVLDAPGAPVAKLQVTIIPTLGQERSTRTDGAGRYLFDDLIDGEYQLVIGARHNPLVGPEELSFRAPSLHYPVRRVPELGSARVRAVNQGGLPLRDARVDGFAPDGGVLGGVSDSGGYCVVDNLVPGRYSLSVRGAGDAVGRGVCFVTAGEQAEIEITVRD